MITKRGARWGVRVYLSEGEYRWVGTFDTKREATAAERAASSKPRLSRSVTCDAFSDRWLVDYSRKAAATRRTNSYALVKFKTDFHGVRLDDVDRPRARAWASENPQSNVRVVRAMFNDALRDGLVHANPFSNLRLEQSRGRRDLVALTELELLHLADCARGIHDEYGLTLRAMVLFAAYVGIRPGEMCVLEPHDIDFANSEVHVRQNLDGRNNVKLPKNNKTRKVTLPPVAAQALQAMPMAVGQRWVFQTPTGRRFSKSTLYYYWRPVRVAFGRPELQLYELRHYCATMLLEKGVSHADVAVQLGHTDGGRLVMSTYGHPEETNARRRLKAVFQPQAA